MARSIEIAFRFSILALLLLLIGAWADLPGGWAGVWALAVWPALAVTGALAILRRRIPRAEGRPGLGLLNDLPRAPLTEVERKVHVAFNISQMLSSRDRAPDHPLSLITDEVHRLDQLWKARRKGAPMSDDELRSIRLMYLYANPLDWVSEAENEALLADVADTDYLRALRQRIVARKAGAAAAKADYAAWRAHVGDPSMAHLLKDGWIAFLSSQPEPDTLLWHSVATDFLDIEVGDRLDAAFWILAQPGCDRATASDFIRGYAGYELLEKAAKAGRMDEIAAYRSVIERYNAGFYKGFSIDPETFEILSFYGNPTQSYDTAAVIALFDRVEQKTGLAPLPRPLGLLAKSDRPSHPPPGQSRYFYNSSDGLQLAYPGPGWRNDA